MLSRFVLASAAAAGARRVVPRGVQQQLKRTYQTNYEVSAPPQRHQGFLWYTGMFTFITVVMMSYPVYVLLNLDNVRTLSVEDLSDELKAELEERRKLRAEGKLNVLVQKT